MRYWLHSDTIALAPVAVVGAVEARRRTRREIPNQTGRYLGGWDATHQDAGRLEAVSAQHSRDEWAELRRRCDLQIMGG